MSHPLLRGLFVLNLAVLAALAHAQVPPLPLEPITPPGPQPHVGIGGYALVVHDARNERVLLLSDTLLWAFDLRSNTWQQPRRLALPPGVIEAGYDATRNVLVLWNGSVGDVYLWRDGDSTTTRVDRSFPHRTQYGHAGFLHPRTGDLHAFGGYGFWYYRNLITRYDRRAREWFLVPLAEGSPQPEERTDALAAYWPAEDALFVLGGVAGEGTGGRQEPGRDVMLLQQDLWRYDYRTGRWAPIGLPGERPSFARYYPSAEPPTAGNAAAFSALDEASGLWFVLGRNGEPARGSAHAQAALYGVDLRTGALGLLGTLMSASEAPLGFVWDAPRSRLVVLRYLMTTSGARRPVVVQAAHMEPMTALAVLPPPEWAEGRIAVAALTVLAVVGLALLLLRRGRWEGPPVAERAIAPPAEAAVGGGTTISVNAEGAVIKAGGAPLPMPETERKLLALLAAARQRGAPFVGTGCIEEALFAGHENFDYVRKMRNLALKRLAERLESFRVGPGDLIESRRSPEDRRRIEYALGDAVRISIEG